MRASRRAGARFASPSSRSSPRATDIFKGGIVDTIPDSAGGYAAYSLVPADSSVLTVEYKLNLIAPAGGFAWGHQPPAAV
ncbi:MAG: hypothetical protein ACT4P2_16500 [Pseudomonadota bacterium]